MQRAREIARLRTTLVGAEQPDDIPAGESRRSRYRTRSSSRTKSRGTSRDERSQSRNSQYSSSDDDEEDRPYDRAYMRRSRSRIRSRSRGKSWPKSRADGDQRSAKDLGTGLVKHEEEEGKTEELDSGSYEECTVDSFCWVCHRLVEVAELGCVTCERRFHPDCVGRGGMKPTAWSCPECALELASDQAENRSWAMRQISVTQLGTLLKFAVKEMKERVKSSELFAAPVSLKTHPSYRRFILRPMDLSLLSSRVDSLSYGSPAGFLADAKYILHNSVVFNDSGSGITRIARRMLGICASQMDEIETCPECYLRAHTQEDWFTGVCASPHLLVWAKSGRYPFWPAKVVKVCGNEIDCRFFGAHEKALIPSSLVFLFSSHPPTGPIRNSGRLAEALEECHVYISNLQKRHGLFCLAPNRIQLIVEKMSSHLLMQLPNLPAQPDTRGKKDTTVIAKVQKPGGSKPERPDNKPSPKKELPEKLPGDSEMSDLQRLDALHRDFLEAESPMADVDDSSNEDALSWHPTSQLAAKNTAVSPLITNEARSPVTSPVAGKKTPSPAVSPLAGKKTPSPAISPLATRKTPSPVVLPLSARKTPTPASPMSDKLVISMSDSEESTNSLTASPTDSKAPMIRTVDIKTLMPEPKGSPSKPGIGKTVLVQHVVNQSAGDPKFALKSPGSASQSNDRMILVATSDANKFVAVTSAGSGVTYTLCKSATGTSSPGQSGARQVALATPGAKYVSVVNKNAASGSSPRPAHPIGGLQPKPVAVTTVQGFKTIAAKPVPTTVPINNAEQTVKGVTTNPVSPTKSILVQAVKKLEVSPVTAAKSNVANSVQTVRLVPSNSAATREVIAVTAVSNTKTLSVQSNSRTVFSVPFVKNMSARNSTALKPLTLNPIQTVKAIGATATTVPHSVATLTTTTASGTFPIISARTSSSPITLVSSQPRDRGTMLGNLSSVTMNSISAAKNNLTSVSNKDGGEVLASPVSKVPTAAITKNADEEVVSGKQTFTVARLSPNLGEGFKKVSASEIANKIQGEILTLTPMKTAAGENSKKDATGEISNEAAMGILTLVPMKAAELPKKIVPKEESNKAITVSVLSSKKSIAPTPSEVMPEFESVFLEEPMDTSETAVNADTHGGKKPVPGAASNRVPKLIYVSSGTEPNLKRTRPSNVVGDFTILTQAEFDRKRKRSRYEFDPSRPLTLVEHPPPGVKATPLPVGASPQTASRASPVGRPLPTSNLRKIAACPSNLAPQVNKLNLTARKSISGAGVTIACLPKASPSPAETLEITPKSSVSSEPSPVDKTLAELGAKAFAEFYERFLETAANEGHSEAKFKKKQLELDRTRWRMQEQINEQRSAHLLLLNERAASFRNQLNAQFGEVGRIQREMEDLKADFKTQLIETKKKQWCAACLREAKFHCCWNTSYCAKPCQLAHWAKHNVVCKNRQVCRNYRAAQLAKTTPVTPKEVVREEGELDPEATAARKAALDNAARVIEAVVNADTTDVTADSESQPTIGLPRTSIDSPSQSLNTSDSPNPAQNVIDLTDQKQPTTDLAGQLKSSTDPLTQSQPATKAVDPSQSSAESDSLEGDEPSLYMDCEAEGNDSDGKNPGATSPLGSVRVVSVRSLGGDHSLWKQKAMQAEKR